MQFVHLFPRHPFHSTSLEAAVDLGVGSGLRNAGLRRGRGGRLPMQWEGWPSAGAAAGNRAGQGSLSSGGDRLGEGGTSGRKDRPEGLLTPGEMSGVKRSWSLWEG